MTLQKNGRNGSRGREEASLRHQAFFFSKGENCGSPL